MALHLAERGYDIALHYHASEREAQETCAAVRGLGRRCELFQADLTDTTALKSLVRQVRAALPQCNMLVNNASVFEPGPFMEADEASFDRHISVNLKAPVFLTQAFVREASGPVSIVNVLDAKITANTHSYFFYLLSKKALAEFTRMAAATLGPNVRVNAVCPGFILPSGGRFDEEYQERLASQLPLKRTATPEEVARAVHTLLANDALTGQFLYVDGGESVG